MSRQLVLLPIIAAAVIAALPASTAHARSCGPMQNRYVVSCEGQRCTGGFWIREVAAFGVCSRRPVVEDIEPEVAEFLAPLIATSGDGLYTFALRFPYWQRAENDGSLEWVLARLGEGLLSSDERERIDLRRLEPSELRRRLDEYYGPSWLSREAAYGSVQEARRAVRDEARRELAIDVLSWIVYWVSFGAVLLWFIHSVHTYFRRLYAPDRTGPRRLASPLLSQLVIGVLGVVPIFLDRVQFWPGTLLIPAVVVTFLAEVWAGYRSRKVA